MQTKVVSLVEACVNVGSGFLLSMVIWQAIANPLFGYDISLVQNFGLTSIFTVVSVARSYLWRRFFARGLNSALIKWVRLLAHKRVFGGKS